MCYCHPFRLGSKESVQFVTGSLTVALEKQNGLIVGGLLHAS
jgi:hypothetical protein